MNRELERVEREDVVFLCGVWLRLCHKTQPNNIKLCVCEKEEIYKITPDGT